jgi:hypothetical protein
VIYGAASVVIVGLWLAAADRDSRAAAPWSAALSTVTLNGTPVGYDGWQSDVATVLGTLSGLLLIGAGLALLVGLLSDRFRYGPAEDYTGPTRLPKPTRRVPR